MTKNIQSEVIDLLPNSKYYFNHPIFKSRVELNYDLMCHKDDEAIKHIINVVNNHIGRKIGIEMITKKTAQKIYEELLEKYKNGNIYLYTSSTTPDERSRIIDACKTQSDVIVVATQTIEAGVDISFEVGVKNIGLLESDRQFLGRINRNNEYLQAICYFCEADDPAHVYTEENIRLMYSQKEAEGRRIIAENDFDTYYKNCLAISESGEKNIKDFWLKAIAMCDFENICQRLKLIKTNTIPVYIINGGDIVNGKHEAEVLYEELLKAQKESTFEKKVLKVSAVSSQMQKFIINVNENRIPDNIDIKTRGSKIIVAYMK